MVYIRPQQNSYLKLMTRSALLLLAVLSTKASIALNKASFPIEKHEQQQGNTIAALNIQVAHDPANIHLQYTKIIVDRTTRATDTLTLAPALISSALQSNVHICGTDKNAEHICAPNFLSTCGAATRLAPGQSCYYWLHALDQTRLVSKKQGGMQIAAQAAHSQPILVNVHLNYNMSLYFGGQGLTTNHQDYYNLFRYDGAQLLPLGPFTSGPKSGPLFLAGAIFDGDLYLGGKFSQIEAMAAKNIAYWNSQNYVTNLCQQGQYSILCGPDSYNPQIDAMESFKNSLYIGGEFHTINGLTTENIAQFSITPQRKFNAMGQGLVANYNDGAVYVLKVIHQILYIGGEFNPPDGMQGYNMMGWDGQNWQSVGQFPNSINPSSFLVEDIENINGQIFAGLSTSNTRAPALYQYNSSGEWQVANPYGVSAHTLDDVTSMIYFNNHFYATSYYYKNGDLNNDVFVWSDEASNWINTHVTQYNINLGKLVEFNDGNSDQLYYGNNDEYQEGTGVMKYDGFNWNVIKDINGKVLSGFMVPVIIPAAALTVSVST